MPEQFKVEHLDHVHVYVLDRHIAAEWYKNALGLSIPKKHKDWA